MSEMFKMTDKLPHYDRTKSYEWNFGTAPEPVSGIEVPDFPGEWSYCGLPVNSPLGIAAGPLLNGNWGRYYASLGFDVLTYKTVRSRPRDCYELPNLLPVDAEMMFGHEGRVTANEEWKGSWAVSFGMPSKAPDFWMKDVRQTRERLANGQLLSVSVVGTMQAGWGINELANDYSLCASNAFAASADCVEMNFSCPNVCSEDGQLFQQPDQAEFVAAKVRETVGADVPLLVKIGFVDDERLLETLLCGLSGNVNAIVTTNSLPARVQDRENHLLFEGQQRGICGRSTRDASMTQVARCRKIIQEKQLDLEVVGVGGIESADDVHAYLNSGADSVQLATSPMMNPTVGIDIRKNF